MLHLEWDRGTEQPRRLRAKLAAYASYFNDRAAAGANQILFVAPTEQRERQILGCFAITRTATARVTATGARQPP